MCYISLSPPHLVTVRLAPIIDTLTKARAQLEQCRQDYAKLEAQTKQEERDANASFLEAQRLKEENSSLQAQAAIWHQNNQLLLHENNSLKKNIACVNALSQYNHQTSVAWRQEAQVLEKQLQKSSERILCYQDAIKHNQETISEVKRVIDRYGAVSDNSQLVRSI